MVSACRSMPTGFLYSASAAMPNKHNCCMPDLRMVANSRCWCGQYHARISREASQVAAARNRSRRSSDWAKPFIWPAEGRISGVYGSQRVLNGKPKRPHYGIDLAAPVGSAVVAPAAGVVVLAEDDLYYSGGTIIIDHGDGVSSTFLHLHSVDVALQQQVGQGDHIGNIGATGRATGPHLDWRMNWRDQRVDPRLLLEPDSWQPAE